MGLASVTVDYSKSVKRRSRTATSAFAGEAASPGQALCSSLDKEKEDRCNETFSAVTYRLVEGEVESDRHSSQE